MTTPGQRTQKKMSQRIKVILLLALFFFCCWTLVIHAAASEDKPSSEPSSSEPSPPHPPSTHHDEVLRIADEEASFEDMLRRILPKYLRESSSPKHHFHSDSDSEHHHHAIDLIEPSYTYSHITDEHSPENILNHHQQSLLSFIVGTAVQSYSELFGSDFMDNPDYSLLQSILNESRNEKYEQDMIRLKIKLLFSEIERNIRGGVSRDVIGWLVKISRGKTLDPQKQADANNPYLGLDALLERELYEEDTKSFKEMYPAEDGCSGYSGVLFVPGLYTEWYPFYFAGLRRDLEQCGMEFRISKVNTGGSLEKNAEFLKDEILEYSKELTDNSTTIKPIMVIGHSKGACDVALCLSKYQHELKPHVRGVISLQAPYAGSALANDISEFGASRILLLKILIEDILGGELKAIDDLSYRARQALIAQYPFPSDKFPCISLSAYDTNPLSLMYPAISYLKLRYNVTNDGLVPTIDGYIPGCRYIVLDAMDHSGGAFTGFPNLSQYDPAKLSLTLLHMFEKLFGHY